MTTYTMSLGYINTHVLGCGDRLQSVPRLWPTKPRERYWNKILKLREGRARTSHSKSAGPSEHLKIVFDHITLIVG